MFWFGPHREDLRDALCGTWACFSVHVKIRIPPTWTAHPAGPCHALGISMCKSVKWDDLVQQLWFYDEKIRCSPEPQELWEDGSNEAVDEDVRPHQLAGKLEGLKACVVEQEEAGPQQQQVEQTHKPWETRQAQTVWQQTGRKHWQKQAMSGSIPKNMGMSSLSSRSTRRLIITM